MSHLPLIKHNSKYITFPFARPTLIYLLTSLRLNVSPEVNGL